MRPLQQILPTGGKLIYTEPTEAFMLQLKVAALAGLVIAAPVIMWQLWLFVAPGLYAREKRFALPFVLLLDTCRSWAAPRSRTTSCFPPRGVLRQLQQRLHGVHAEDLGSLRPVLVCCWPLAVIFQMPTLVLALARMGVVTAGFLWRHTKYAILIIFILGRRHHADRRRREPDADGRADDRLYLLSIIIAWVFGRSAGRRTTDRAGDASPSIRADADVSDRALQARQ